MALIDRLEPIDTAWQKTWQVVIMIYPALHCMGIFFAEAEQTARRALALDR